MTSPSVDGAAEVRAALRDILREYGAAGLDDAKLVAQLLPDLLAASPREAKLILAATSAGVAGILRTRQAQGMTLQGAIRDASVMLAQDSMIDAGMCDWIVTEFASSLGYPTATTSMPETTSAPPAHVRSDPTSIGRRSDPTTIDRPPTAPLPPTRVAGPPPPRYGPPQYSAIPQSPPYGPPVPYPARPAYQAQPSYQIVPPPMVLRPVPPRRGGNTALIVTLSILLVVVLCGGALYYVGYQAEKNTPKSFAQCVDGHWSVTTAKDSVRMPDGTIVPTTYSSGSIIRTFNRGTGDEAFDWTEATFTGTYKGQPVTTVYSGAASWPYTTSGDGSSAYLAALSVTVPVDVTVTALGQTAEYQRTTVPSTNAHTTCTNTTLTVYDNDGLVYSSWSRRS